jgi:hypothetical protein
LPPSTQLLLVDQNDFSWAASKNELYQWSLKLSDISHVIITLRPSYE